MNIEQSRLVEVACVVLAISAVCLVVFELAPVLQQLAAGG